MPGREREYEQGDCRESSESLSGVRKLSTVNKPGEQLQPKLTGQGSLPSRPQACQASRPVSARDRRSAYISVRIYFLALPNSQETTLGTAKTQASDIGPPEIRQLSATSRLTIANGRARPYPAQWSTSP